MDGSNISHRVSGWLSGGGALSGFFAFLGASCCVVPILLVHFGVATGIVAQLAWFGRWQTPILWVAAGLLVIALTAALWSGRARPVFWISWGIGALFILIALVLPQYEPGLQSWLLDWTRSQ